MVGDENAVEVDDATGEVDAPRGTGTVRSKAGRPVAAGRLRRPRESSNDAWRVGAKLITSATNPVN